MKKRTRPCETRFNSIRRRVRKMSLSIRKRVLLRTGANAIRVTSAEPATSGVDRIAPVICWAIVRMSLLSRKVPPRLSSSSGCKMAVRDGSCTSGVAQPVASRAPAKKTNAIVCLMILNASLESSWIELTPTVLIGTSGRGSAPGDSACPTTVGCPLYVVCHTATSTMSIGAKVHTRLSASSTRTPGPGKKKRRSYG